MRRLRGSIVVISLFLLLALATCAAADCAWVLWYEEIVMRFPDKRAEAGPADWRIVQAKVSEAECARSLATEIREAPRATSPYREIKVGDNNTVLETIFQVSDDQRQLVAMSSRHYLCLPDTVDPRGPKGK